ncbi:MAG: histone deacetylase, partial [Acidimicrobiia bacterium]
HNTGPHHPERPERIEAVRRGVYASGLGIVEIEAPRISKEHLAVVHSDSHIRSIEELCLRGGGMIDTDTIVVEASWEAALRSAGAVQAVVDELDRRSGATGFALCRPPGHHALPSRAMGFCLFNNVAVTAALLRSRGERVAILDFDVHHGNGTQAMLGRDPGVLYISLHQAAFYPLTGEITDIDREAVGTTLNIPLPAGTGGDIYRRAWDEIVMPVVVGFDPDRILVSAGFDGHVRDLLADLRLVAADYGWIAHSLSRIHPPERTVLALEGGYDLFALEESVAATLAGLAGVPPEGPPLTSPPGAESVLKEAVEAVTRYWSL